MREYFFSQPKGWPEIVYRLLLAALIIWAVVYLRRGQMGTNRRVDQVATAVTTASP